MSVAPGKYRRINIGFKPAGTDPLQDQAFEILQALNKKGAKSHFISISISEYISAHQNVIGSQNMGTVLILSSASNTESSKKRRDYKKSPAKQTSSDTGFQEGECSCADKVFVQEKPEDRHITESAAEQINNLLDMFIEIKK